MKSLLWHYLHRFSRGSQAMHGICVERCVKVLMWVVWFVSLLFEGVCFLKDWLDWMKYFLWYAYSSPRNKKFCQYTHSPLCVWYLNKYNRKLWQRPLLSFCAIQLFTLEMFIFWHFIHNKCIYATPPTGLIFILGWIIPLKVKCVMSAPFSHSTHLKYKNDFK